MAKKEIEFPFKPNEKVRAAFRQERQMKDAIKLMTQALAEVVAGIHTPFEMMINEHPELNEYRWNGISYNHLTEEIDIKK